MKGSDKEALRQQMLLRALLGDARPGVVGGWLRDGERLSRGLAAYRANAGALAERALAAAFPTLQQMLGAESFAALARAFWQRHPPEAGDIACWGGRLADFVADAEQLAEEPCLADVARLEWGVHEAGRAADAPAQTQGLERLAAEDPAALGLQLAPGTVVLASRFPVVTIWLAHRDSGEHRFDAVRAAFAAGLGETAQVRRQGFRVVVDALDAAAAGFTTAVLQGRSLARALDAAGPDFSFEAWMIRALRQGLLTGVSDLRQERRT